jgi:flagellar biosynthesis component FlhA
LDPATSRPAAIIGAEYEFALAMAGLTTWSPLGFVILSMAQAIREHAFRLMDSRTAGQLLDEVGTVFPSITMAVDNRLSRDALASVLRDMLCDRVSIRNLRRIVELLLRREDEAADAADLDPVTYVRWGLADQLAEQVARGTSTVFVYLLAKEIEAALVGRDLTDHDELRTRVLAAVDAQMALLPPAAPRPAILTRDDVRAPLREVLRRSLPNVFVLGYGDLPPHRNVQPVDRIQWV